MADSTNPWSPASLLAWLRSTLAMPTVEKRDDFGAPYLVRQNGQTVQVDSLENLLVTPIRKTGKASFHNIAHFGEYVNRHNKNRVTFYDKESKAIVALLDHHEATPTGAAGWNKHVAVFSPIYTRAWAEWTAMNDKPLDQVTWSDFIQDHLGQIIQPNASDLLELSLNFEASKEVHYVSRRDLSNGTNEYTFNEIVDGGSRKGTMKAPKELTLAMPIYEGEDVGPPFTARLGFRLPNHQLRWAYKIIAAADLEDAAFQAQVDKLVTNHGVEVFQGKWGG